MTWKVSGGFRVFKISSLNFLSVFQAVSGGFIGFQKDFKMFRGESVGVREFS